jgi:hypothetical protein
VVFEQEETEETEFCQAADAETLWGQISQFDNSFSMRLTSAPAAEWSIPPPSSATPPTAACPTAKPERRLSSPISITIRPEPQPWVPRSTPLPACCCSLLKPSFATRTGFQCGLPAMWHRLPPARRNGLAADRPLRRRRRPENLPPLTASCQVAASPGYSMRSGLPCQPCIDATCQIVN